MSDEPDVDVDAALRSLSEPGAFTAFSNALDALAQKIKTPDTATAPGPAATVSGSMQVQFDDDRLYRDARARLTQPSKLSITIDMGPRLDAWLEHPAKFAEEIVFRRDLLEWERSAVIRARHSVDLDGVSDRIEALKRIAEAMLRAIGKTSAENRRLRKRDRVRRLREYRRHPDIFRSVEHRHRWISARCGMCRTLYAVETFISFIDKRGLRQYLTEHETILDCGHPSLWLYPVEWEKRGYTPTFTKL